MFAASMAALTGLSTALPPHVVTLEETKAHLAAHVEDRSAATRFEEMAEHSRIAQRHVVLPAEHVLRIRTIEERQQEYGRHAVDLGETVAKDALATAGVDPGSVGVVLSVSCTGYMMPSLEVHLGHRLGLNPAARRVPITELGCSGGVAAIGLASEILKAGRAGQNALVVTTELSSLCLQTAEPAISDVMGGILFGDASAAAVITSDNRGKGPRILGSRSVLWPESTSDLGMRLTTTGFRLELSRHVPRLIRRHLRSTVDTFLADHRLTLSDLSFWAIHPGGPRILESIGESLGLSNEALRPSWEVWETCGNLSSATALFILRALLDADNLASGALGMLLAAGPGLSCEMVLLRS